MLLQNARDTLFHLESSRVSYAYNFIKMWSLHIAVIIIVVLLNICLACGNRNTAPSATKSVETSDGTVIGRLEETIRLKKPFYAFRGIPYAKPPTGERRFKVNLKVLLVFKPKRWM